MNTVPLRTPATPGHQNFCAQPQRQFEPVFRRTSLESHNTPGDYPLVSNTRQTLSYELTSGDEVSISGTILPWVRLEKAARTNQVIDLVDDLPACTVTLPV